MSLAHFLDAVMVITLAHQGSIVSWIRSTERNEQEDGHEESLHLLGFAVDAVFDTDEGKHRAMTAARRLGLIAIDEGDHVHMQIRK